MLTTREVILVKEEATYNTDAAPSPSSDAVLVENLQWSNEGARMNERAAVKNTFGKLQQVFGGTLRTVSFDVEIKGSGAAGTPPEFGPLLKACGMAETIVASTSVTYDPASTGIKSATIYYYQDGTLMKLTGCRGDAEWKTPTGEVGKMTFTMTGHVSPVTDVALPNPSYDSTVPAPFIGAGFTVGSYGPVIANLTVSLGNQLAMPPDANAADGFGEVRITGRDVAGSFDPEHQLVATSPFDADWRAGTTFSMATGTIGSAAGNIYEITAPAMYYRELSPGDRDAIRTLEISCGFTESAGDDEISIVFT